MKILHLLSLTTLLLARLVGAQVPALLNYQGRVAVGGVNFDGPGQFKFALVNADASQSFWSNDGTSAAGGEPTAAVPLTVTKGLYSVLLGDTSLTNMEAIPPGVFENAYVCLRVWFNDGPNDFQLLSPDQRITAVGYSMVAGNVPDGSITAAKIADGAVDGGKLAPGAAAANLGPGWQTGVPSGTLVLSATGENTALEGAGFVFAGVTAGAELWRELARPAFINPADFTRGGLDAAIPSVWTGKEMIFWQDGFGGRFNPATNIWTPVSTTGAPAAAIYHTAVWTGTEMIVWGGGTIPGGGQPSTFTDTGGRYNPTTDTWTPTSTVNAPSARRQHSAVWTGTEMIVWGGRTSSLASGVTDTGGRYNPTTDTWTPVTLQGTPPAGRYLHAAVWTGTYMLVWGGTTGGTSGVIGDGARYLPGGGSFTWTPMPAFSPRAFHSAVWTGSEMIIWGGWDNTIRCYNTGGRYSPTTNTWSATSTVGAPPKRLAHAAVWTGSEMIVWGGADSENQFAKMNSGGRYNPANNTWSAMPTFDAATPRDMHSSVWTGSEMLIWSGLIVTNPQIGNAFTNDLFSYIPGRALYLFQRP